MVHSLPVTFPTEKYLYAFYWSSEHFEKRMYFKFSLCTDAGRTHLYVYSLHESTDKDNGVEEE